MGLTQPYHVKQWPQLEEAFLLMKFIPVSAKFFSGNKNVYQASMSFLHIDMTQVVEILPQIKQELTYST